MTEKAYRGTRPRDIRPASGCMEIVEEPTCEDSRPIADQWICGAGAEEVTAAVLSGRIAPRSAYCAEHGGPERAQAECARDWAVLAPASVGDQHGVEQAGCRSLSSEHATVVLRQLPGRWIAQLGLGGRIRDIPGSHPTREAALAAGCARWQAKVEEEVEAIRSIRGGTLSWGLAVQPLAEPIILEPRAGESAWDAYSRRLGTPAAAV